MGPPKEWPALNRIKLRNEQKLIIEVVGKIFAVGEEWPICSMMLFQVTDSKQHMLILNHWGIYCPVCKENVVNEWMRIVICHIRIALSNRIYHVTERTSQTGHHTVP